MKTQTIFFLVCLLFTVSCKETITGPSSGTNLLTNSTFEWNGIPSLHGWIVLDTAGVQFSTDVPSGGSGRSIIVHPSWLPTWPIGIVYQTIPAFVGTHRYLISVFGKKNGVSGGVRVGLSQPQGIQWKGGIGVPDTAWTFYSSVDTITAGSGDSIIVAISTGACEICLGTTYLNTCKLEKLD